MIFPGKTVLWWAGDGKWTVRDGQGNVYTADYVKRIMDGYTETHPSGFVRLPGKPKGVVVCESVVVGKRLGDQ